MSNYPDLDKRYGQRKVRRVRAAIKRGKPAGYEPAYVELRVRLENE